MVSPWGEVIAEAKGVETGVILADINKDEVERARNRLPSLRHDRLFHSQNENG